MLCPKRVGKEAPLGSILGSFQMQFLETTPDGFHELTATPAQKDSTQRRRKESFRRSLPDFRLLTLVADPGSLAEPLR